MNREAAESVLAVEAPAPGRVAATDEPALLATRLAELTHRPPGRSRPRVLIVGNYGNGNTGDEAILSGILQVMPPHVDLTVVSRNPGLVSELHGVPAVRTLSRQSIDGFLRADVLLIGGGGMFGRGIPPLVSVLPLVALAAAALRKRVGFVALGAYSDTPRIPLAWLRRAASRAQMVTVRDHASRRVLDTGRRRGVPGPIVVGDPATWVVPSAASELASQGLLPDGPRPLVISLKAVPDRELRTRVCDAIAHGLAAADIPPDMPIVFLCLSDQGDYGLGASVSDRMLAQFVIDASGLHAQSSLIGPGLHPAQAKGVIARARGVIAMRLHAQIFAASTGVDYLALSFEEKADAWAADRGARRLPVSQTDPQAITDWCAQLLGDPPTATGMLM